MQYLSLVCPYCIPGKLLANSISSTQEQPNKNETFLVNRVSLAASIGDLHSFLNSATNIQHVWATQYHTHFEVMEQNFSLYLRVLSLLFTQVYYLDCDLQGQKKHLLLFLCGAEHNRACSSLLQQKQ